MHHMGPPTGMLHLFFSGYAYGKCPLVWHVSGVAQ